MDNFNLRKYLAEGKLLKENKPWSDYLDVDQEKYNDLKDRLDDEFDGNVEDFTDEYGADFLSPNLEKINKYYGAKVSINDLSTDFFEADGLEFISSNERFEEWLDRNREFYLAEGNLHEPNGGDAIKYLEDSLNYAKEEILIKYLEDGINYLKNIPEDDDLGSAILAISDGFKGADSDEEIAVADGFEKFVSIYSLSEGKLTENNNPKDHNSPEYEAQLELANHPNYEKVVGILTDGGFEVMGVPYTEGTGRRDIDGIWKVIKWSSPKPGGNGKSGRSATVKDINNALQQAGINNIIARNSRPYTFRLTKNKIK